ncbi:hypothetical protein ACIBUY_00480 [Streptomyces sp. NPDC050085]|uniref:hypothetical protein n=1 Tax=Streptomyces sp. NPDC050085 TaxID=3365600 RepID=UPI00378DE40E
MTAPQADSGLGRLQAAAQSDGAVGSAPLPMLLDIGAIQSALGAVRCGTGPTGGWDGVTEIVTAVLARAAAGLRLIDVMISCPTLILVLGMERCAS